VDTRRTPDAASSDIGGPPRSASTFTGAPASRTTLLICSIDVRPGAYTAFAPAYTLGNIRFGLAQDVERFKFSEYVRVNNIANVNYVGSVIVGDTNGRYYEPAPGRNWYAGVSISAAF